jgi:hypothetical protein
MEAMRCLKGRLSARPGIREWLAAKAQSLIVTGAEGPLREIELGRAWKWGAALARGPPCPPAADRPGHWSWRSRVTV